MRPEEQLYSYELTDLVLDPRLQIRTGGLDDEHVATLADMPAASLPPIDVVYEAASKTSWLVDGFHRLEAARRRGETTVVARVFQGDFRDALLLALGANSSHGLRRTNADKARAVDTLLADDEWKLWANTEIAERCGVSEGFVRNRRADRGESPKVRKFKDASGTEREMNTENIGGGGEPRRVEVERETEPAPAVEVQTPYAVAVSKLDRLHNMAKQLKAEIRMCKGEPWGAKLGVTELCDQVGVIMAAIREASPAEADENHPRGWLTKAEVEQREAAAV